MRVRCPWTTDNAIRSSFSIRYALCSCGSALHAFPTFELPTFPPSCCFRLSPSHLPSFGPVSCGLICARAANFLFLALIFQRSALPALLNSLQKRAKRIQPRSFELARSQSAKGHRQRHPEFFLYALCSMPYALPNFPTSQLHSFIVSSHPRFPASQPKAEKLPRQRTDPLPAGSDQYLPAAVGQRPISTGPVRELDGRDVQRRLEFKQGR
jgi:hypothetical protein